ncbi:DUF4149 domain-containing protein [Massilia sp. CF038]|uniref:DUF4149 domain-containing protein n=1 Tax=Massilia sp. CF038 TaxID=1881045 RepID=UPI000923019F|nr:DUF4149 domain-containing protein [Massilia sp. CF038]SHH03070.1 protein of unknown function [Massilia sp. CF038]
MLLAKARLLLITLWAGSLWTVGYLVAPTLFGTLADRALAGTIAGSMFRVEAWLSLVCGAAVIGLLYAAKDVTVQRRKTLVLIVVGMLVCTLVSHFGLQPVMASMREAGDRASFGMLHGVSMVLYLVQAVLAVILVVKNP